MASLTGTYLQHTTLVDALPPLVRQQRKLEAKIAAVAQDEKDEKAVRGQIDQLLIAAGLQPSAVVTCGGYDVQHHKRAGQESLNPEKVTAFLLAKGVDAAFVATVITDSTDTAKPALFATVKPSKGSQVRLPAKPKPARMRLLGRVPDRQRA